MNTAQQILVAVYGGGDYAHIASVEESREVGDTLFTFLMIELSDEEDCEDILIAINRVASAIDQLRELKNELESKL